MVMKANPMDFVSVMMIWIVVTRITKAVKVRMMGMMTMTHLAVFNFHEI